MLASAGAKDSSAPVALESHPDLKEKWKNLNPHTRHDFIDLYQSGISGKYGVPIGRMGYYGSFATGVISYADINANLAGQKFYQKLFAAYELGQRTYSFSFSIKDYDITRFNEQTVKNAFVPGLRVNDNK